MANKLQQENLINEDVGYTMFESFGNNQDLITNWASKNMGKKFPKKYSPSAEICLKLLQSTGVTIKKV